VKLPEPCGAGSMWLIVRCLILSRACAVIERTREHESMDGLSVIICSHDGVSRLAPTLAHLKKQESPAAPWEVLVIDNASTDGAAEFARSC
jgi:hypothetical protein